MTGGIVKLTGLGAAGLLLTACGGGGGGNETLRRANELQQYIEIDNRVAAFANDELQASEGLPDGEVDYTGFGVVNVDPVSFTRIGDNDGDVSLGIDANVAKLLGDARLTVDFDDGTLSGEITNFRDINDLDDDFEEYSGSLELSDGRFGTIGSAAAIGLDVDGTLEGSAGEIEIDTEIRSPIFGDDGDALAFFGKDADGASVDDDDTPVLVTTVLER